MGTPLFRGTPGKKIEEASPTGGNPRLPKQTRGFKKPNPGPKKNPPAPTGNWGIKPEGPIKGRPKRGEKNFPGKSTIERGIS